jgi:Relaxase/Mobilisation nuclease domain/Large polyvalent protein-associated domain 7
MKMAAIMERQQADGLIIKEIRSSRDLTDYLSKFTGEEFERLTHYLDLDAAGRGHEFRALNFVSKTLPGILAEMRVIQGVRKHGRAQHNVYHFMIGKRGKTDPEHLMHIGERLLTLLELDRQHALLVVHDDTENTHLHVAVDAREPNGNKIEINKGWTKFALQHANAVLCYENGLTPEAGLDFHANEDGVFSSNGQRVRDADFNRVSNYAEQLKSARSARARREEAETGLQSTQCFLQNRVLDIRANARSVESFIHRLAEADIRYEFIGSGAKIGFGDAWFKASQISPQLSPKKLAAHFGVRHFTAKEAEVAGFYRDTPYGPQNCIEVFRKDWTPKEHVKEELPGIDAAQARANAELDKEELARFPQFEAAHAEPIREERRRSGQLSKAEPWFSQDRADAEANWIFDQLSDLLRRMSGTLRGRPSKRRTRAHDGVPDVKVNSIKGCLMGSIDRLFMPVRPWTGTRYEAKGKFDSIYRGSDLVVNFTPKLATFHNATDRDLVKALHAATNRWGKVNVYGDNKFQRRMIRLAVREGLVLGNVELADYQAWARDSAVRQLTNAAIAQAAALSDLSKRLSTAAAQIVARKSVQISHFGATLDAAAIMIKQQQAEQTQRAALGALVSRVAAATKKQVSSQAQKLANLGLRLDAQSEAIAIRRAQAVEARQRALALQQQREAEEKARERARALREQRDRASIAARTQANAALRLADAEAKLGALSPKPSVPASTNAATTVPISATPPNVAASDLISTKAALPEPAMPNQERPFALAGPPTSPAPDVLQNTEHKGGTTQSPNSLSAEVNISRTVGPITALVTTPPPSIPSKESGEAHEPRAGIEIQRPQPNDTQAMEETYRLWAAYDAIEEGRGFGSIKDALLTVEGLEDGSKQQFKLDPEEERYAKDRLALASAKLDEIMKAAHAGVIALDSANRPITADAANKDLAQRARYLWRHETARQHFLTAMAEGSAERADTEQSAIMPFEISAKSAAQLRLVALAQKPKDWDQRHYHHIDLGAGDALQREAISAIQSQIAPVAPPQNDPSIIKRQQALAAQRAAQLNR